MTPKRRLIIGGLGAAQTGNTTRGRVAVGLRVPVWSRSACRPRRSRPAGPGCPCRNRRCRGPAARAAGLHRVHFAEDIGRQTPDAVELRLAHGRSSSCRVKSGRMFSTTSPETNPSRRPESRRQKARCPPSPRRRAIALDRESAIGGRRLRSAELIGRGSPDGPDPKPAIASMIIFENLDGGAELHQ